MLFSYRRNKELSQQTVWLIKTVQFQNEYWIFSIEHRESSIAITCNMQYHQYFMLRQRDVRMLCCFRFEFSFLFFFQQCVTLSPLDFSAFFFSFVFALLSVLVVESDELDAFSCYWRSERVYEWFLLLYSSFPCFSVLSSLFRLQCIRFCIIYCKESGLYVTGQLLLLGYVVAK